ncbi:MAG: iron-sulfur cluster assembly scaffold protein [Novosphingobium sp.]
MGASRGLYTPEVLATAMELADHPWNDALPLRGTARSRTCGSVIDLALATDDNGGITRAGVRPHACAIGQAAAALFLRSAAGKDASAIAAARDAIALWLSGADRLPDWPGLALLEPARAHSARHPAILLAWDAALDALGAA